MNDDFYIGWQNKAPRSVARTSKRIVAALMLGALLLSVALAVSQRMIGTAVFEWGVEKHFTGIFRAWPYPHLLVPQPQGPGGAPVFSTYFLVAPWKFGLRPEAVAQFDGKFVSLQGALIYREAQTMIEVSNSLITVYQDKAVGPSLPQAITLGKQTLAGEIVDSKCYLGVMNPGQLAPHRACAILCIQGGIPPILLVRQKVGPPLYLLLVSAAGKPVNQQILDFVAEPVEITGDVERQDGLLVLRADPATYRRLN